MLSLKVVFANGDQIVTGFNGTLKQAKNYYIGGVFNLATGDEDDNITYGVKVEVLNA